MKLLGHLKRVDCNCAWCRPLYLFGHDQIESVGQGLECAGQGVPCVSSHENSLAGGDFFEVGQILRQMLRQFVVQPNDPIIGTCKNQMYIGGKHVNGW